MINNTIEAHKATDMCKDCKHIFGGQCKKVKQPGKLGCLSYREDKYKKVKKEKELKKNKKTSSNSSGDSLFSIV